MQAAFLFVKVDDMSTLTFNISTDFQTLKNLIYRDIGFYDILWRDEGCRYFKRPAFEEVYPVRACLRNRYYH